MFAIPVENRKTLKGINLLPQGVNIFVRFLPFTDKVWITEGKQKDTKVVSFVQNGGKSTQCIHSPSPIFEKRRAEKVPVA